METAQWLTSQAIDIGGSFLGNFFKSGFLYGLLGFFIGIIVVFILRRGGLLKRPNRLWSLFAKFQYVLIPILMAFVFGTFASVRSVHNTVNSWVDSSATQLQAYSNDYIPQIQSLAASVSNSATNTNDKVEDLILDQAEVDGGWMASKFYYAVNRKIIGYTLETLGLENNPAGIADLAEPANLTKLSEMSFANVSGYMKDGLVGTYMSGFYWFLGFLFLPFILFSLGEFLLFFINGRTAPVVKQKIADTKERMRRK